MRWVWTLLLLVATAGPGCESPIVGAECRPGFTLCGSTCVDLKADFRNCGMCDRSCGRFICDDGMCSATQLNDAGPSAEAGARDAGRGADDSGTSDAAPPSDGGTFDPDTGLPGCDLGEQECDGVCSNPRYDASNCGMCGRVCLDDQFCAGGVCADRCEAPLTQCGFQCFDLSQDPQHCGDCNRLCTSGICEMGACADRIAGQAVVLGHDFLAANNAMQRLAGNAVFLARGAPVRVLTYRGEANDASVNGVELAIDVVKNELGRDWRRIEAVESIVPLQLASADVLLIHSQSNARKSTLMKLGQQWGNAIAQFLSAGGVVVLFDAPSTLNDGTFRILEPSQVFSAADRATVGMQQLRVQTPGLGVAVRVPERYMSATNTVRFSGLTTSGTAIVVDRDNLPVVVQRVIIVQ